jgi:hypothetical protein
VVTVLCGGWPASADDRPLVAVRFLFTDPAYRNKFAEDDRRDVLGDLAARTADRLRDRIGFMRFTPDGNADAVLTLDVDRGPDRSPGRALREVGLHATLVYQGQPLGDGAYLTVRPVGSSTAIPDREPLVEQMAQKVSEAAGSLGQITGLLSRIPIARAASFVRDPIGWVIPFRHDQLCISELSVVRVANIVETPTATVAREFTARTSGRYRPPGQQERILGEPHPTAQEHLDEFMNTPVERIRVDAIYVVSYTRHNRCDAGWPSAAR